MFKLIMPYLYFDLKNMILMTKIQEKLHKKELKEGFTRFSLTNLSAIVSIFRPLVFHQINLKRLDIQLTIGTMSLVIVRKNSCNFKNCFLFFQGFKDGQ